MKIDLHLHTNLGSSCSYMDPDQLIERAKSVGLDGVCLTDHNHIWSKASLDRLRKKHDFLILGGSEISTIEGDILVFGIQGSVREIHNPHTLRNRVDDCGGVMILAHPFRYDLELIRRYLKLNDRQQEQTDYILSLLGQRKVFDLIDAIESYNGQSGRNEKAICEVVVDNLPLKGTGGSDAHATLGVGSCYTVFEKPITNERDLIDQIKAGCFYAVDDRWTS